MRVKVNAGGHNIFIPLPSCLLFNSLSAYLVYRFVIPRVDVISKLTYAHTRLLMHSVSRARRKLRGMPLVDVESSAGEKVQIYL